jgi:hypothetical protein
MTIHLRKRLTARYTAAARLFVARFEGNGSGFL